MLEIFNVLIYISNFLHQTQYSQIILVSNHNRWIYIASRLIISAREPLLHGIILYTARQNLKIKAKHKRKRRREARSHVIDTIPLAEHKMCAP